MVLGGTFLDGILVQLKGDALQKATAEPGIHSKYHCVLSGYETVFHETRTKAQLAERAADEQKLAEVHARRDDYDNQWRVANNLLSDAREKAHFARIARLERLLRDAGGEW